MANVTLTEISPGKWAYTVDNIYQEFNPTKEGFEPMSLEEATILSSLVKQRLEDSNFVESSTSSVRSVTRAQAKAALLITGKLDYVQLAIDAIEDPLHRRLVQIDWDDRLTFEENNPTLIALATALGLTTKDLSDLFDLAETL